MKNQPNKALWVTPELHKKIKEKAVKNEKTIIQQLKEDYPNNFSIKRKKKQI